MRRRRRVPRAERTCELQSHISMMLSQLRWETSYFSELSDEYSQAYLEEMEADRYGEVTFLTWLGWAIKGQLCPAGCPFARAGRN